MTTSYGRTETIFFATDGYDSGTKDDVSDTEQFSDAIDLRKFDGVNTDLSFVETGGEANDEMLARIYRKNDSSRDGKEILVQEIPCGTAATEKRKSIVIDASRAPGFYWVGLVVDGSTDEYDAQLAGHFWRKN